LEFLTPVVGSEYDRSGKRKATREVSGVSSQQLRYIEILMVSPWEIASGKGNGYPFAPTKKILIANPCTFLAQKILIHRERSYKDRAKDLLYMHDTIDVFSEHLGELRRIYSKEVRPQFHARRAMELTAAGDGLFGKVNDTIREAALMAAGRKLSAEALAETSRAGLKEIFK
jgi:Nucleotidyltransferase